MGTVHYLRHQSQKDTPTLTRQTTRRIRSDPGLRRTTSLGPGVRSPEGGKHFGGLRDSVCFHHKLRKSRLSLTFISVWDFPKLLPSPCSTICVPQSRPRRLLTAGTLSVRGKDSESSEPSFYFPNYQITKRVNKEESRGEETAPQLTDRGRVSSVKIDNLITDGPFCNTFLSQHDNYIYHCPQHWGV